jgi:nucleoside-diphosphate-sugar epimerase
VLHTASPYQLNVKDAEKDLLIPARDGTLNVLRYAAKVPSIRFFGITSSFAAVSDFSKGGPNRPGFTYTENDWNPNGWKEAVDFGGAGAFAYSASKKVAEEAAWEFKRSNPEVSFEIATFNPPMIYGKTLQPGVKKNNLNTSSATIYAVRGSGPRRASKR